MPVAAGQYSPLADRVNSGLAPVLNAIIENRSAELPAPLRNLRQCGPNAGSDVSISLGATQPFHDFGHADRQRIHRTPNILPQSGRAWFWKSSAPHRWITIDRQTPIAKRNSQRRNTNTSVARRDGDEGCTARNQCSDSATRTVPRRSDSCLQPVLSLISERQRRFKKARPVSSAARHWLKDSDKLWRSPRHGREH